jgi:hypothetical protein
MFCVQVGRQNLLRLCKDLLGNRRLRADFVEPLMKIYNSVQKNVDTRITEIAEIISDLRDPLFSTHSQQQQLLQPLPQEPQPQQDESEEMNVTVEGLSEKEREEELKKAQAEAKKNEEALRKKRVNNFTEIFFTNA